LFKPRPLKWHQVWLANLISGLVKLLALTMRIRWDIPQGVRDLPKDQPVVICVWHNRLVLAFPAYQRFARETGRDSRVAAMVSASRDGGLLARVMENFDVQPVRGSTSRRGPQAMRELTSWAKRGFDLAVTPDGPRGPCYKIQPGVLSVAQLTGLPIMPSSVELKWKWCLRSWDRLQVPIPFGSCVVRFADPLWVARDISEEDRQLAMKDLEKRMQSITVD
jgi:lysophospholipid acyltransferase (LPLAT)-like uncharacterized protein